MQLTKSAIVLFLIMASAIAQVIFTQADSGADAEKMIISYIEAKGLNIEPGTEEYTALMKGILLGEHPELTGENSTFASSAAERNQILSYAATHMNNLASQEYATSPGQLAEPSISEVQLSTFEREQSLQTTITSVSGNRSEAIDYAYAWSTAGGTSRNPAYPDFGADDCTNFISQALHAGGFVMVGSGDGCKHEETNVEWYVNANQSPPLWCLGEFRDWEWSTSWSVPWPFRDYMAHQNSYAIELGWTLDPYVAEYYLKPGDVVQLQYKDASGNWNSYHTMIVTSEDSYELYVTYHSNAGGLDEVDKPLSSIPTGDSQRYVLVQILYVEVYLPLVIKDGGTMNQQETSAPNPYPAPESLYEAPSQLVPYPCPMP